MPKELAQKIKRKSGLTPNERITCAYMYFNTDATGEQIQAAFPGVNPGRISEAIKAIELAANNPNIRAYNSTPRLRKAKK